MPKKNLIVIGAGPAGLSAAYELLKKGGTDEYSVTILEESDMIGGISRTVQFNGNRMDLGGHRFFSKDAEVNAFWEHILPMQGAPASDDILLERDVPLKENGPDPEKTDKAMLTRRRVSRIYYHKHFFDYPISMKKETLKNMGLLTTAKAGFSYLKSTVMKKPEDSLENFYINRFGKKLYSMFFEKYTEKLWGRHPRDIAADWGAQRVKGLSILAILKDMLGKALPNKKNRKVETSLIEEFLYPKLGPGQLWEESAREVERLGGVIRKNARVTGFERSEDGRITKVLFETENGKESMEADAVFSSMPLKDLVASMDASSVPEDVRRIASGLPYRDFVTLGLLVTELDIKNTTRMKTLQNRVPDCWIYVQDEGVKLGRIQVFNNWSPYLVKDPDTTWIGLEYFCTEGDDFWNLKVSDLVRLAYEELKKMGILHSTKQVLAFHREKVRKAYPAYFDTYSEIDRLTEYLTGVENLYCIGRNGQHRYNNMDHSMKTGFLAARTYLSGSADKSEIWAVNTEKDYHEVKEEPSGEGKPNEG